MARTKKEINSTTADSLSVENNLSANAAPRGKEEKVDTHLAEKKKAEQKKKRAERTCLIKTDRLKRSTKS